MDFLSGARALWGLRRSLIFARGEGHQRADISSPPQPESGSRAWQVFGGSRMRFLVVCGMHKRRVGQAKKRRNVDARGSQGAARSPQAAVLQRGQPQHPQVPCLEGFYGGAPPRAIPKKMAALHGCGLGVGCLQVSGRLGAFLPNYIQ